ncbi:MAG: endonuclease/exonuclease/phosphatase family protein, partial [Candidatus Methylomirabilis sp.]|nr:endonuclease/exonuclease/phosphatase family protein [Deltaproteobacteria bacterium]
APAEAVALRAASYNLHGGQESGPEAIGAMLGLLNLDFAGLQEVPDAAFAEAIAAAAGFPNVYFGGGNALLTRAPLADPITVELRAGRGFIRGTLEVGGVPFSVYDAHVGWDLEGNFQNREFMDEWIAPDPNPYLVMVGDYNDEHFSSQNAILEEALDDVWTLLGLYPGERISWPSLRWDGGEGSQLIDFVWVRRAAGAIAVAGDVVNLSPVLSDHKPVWAELLFSADPEAPLAEAPFAALRRADRDFPAALPANLLANGGFEQGTRGWKVKDRMEAVKARESQVAHAGEYFLTGPGCMPQARSYAEQTVSLGGEAVAIDEGRGRLLASAYMTTGFKTLEEAGVASNFVKPYDEAEMRVEVFDGVGAPLSVETSKRRDTLAWNLYAGAVDLPPGARSAKVTLTSYYKFFHSKQPDGYTSDGMFDEVYLGLETLEAPHGVLGGNLLANPGAESGLA